MRLTLGLIFVSKARAYPSGIPYRSLTPSGCKGFPWTNALAYLACLSKAKNRNVL
jgi:hypothetical protein